MFGVAVEASDVAGNSSSSGLVRLETLEDGEFTGTTHAWH